MQARAAKTRLMSSHELVKGPAYHRRRSDPRKAKNAISADPFFQNVRN